MARYFTVPQAERLLPEVERFLRDALVHKAEAQKAGAELERMAEHIRMAGGTRVNHGRHLEVRSRRDASIAALKDALDLIEQAGVLVKDLDIGLIDFLSRFQDRDVCLCWKLGESGIAFWHGLEEGFKGRKPIDEEFLKGHSGEHSERLH